MKYAARYAALAMAMLSGTVFVSGVLRLLRTYDYAHHRFAPSRVSPLMTLFAGITCAAFARVYQLMEDSKSDPVSKTQTEIALFHVGFLSAWFCSIFMVHEMNLPNRSVSSRTLVAFALATAITIWAGFVVRRRLFKRSADALAVNVGEALTHWKGAHFVGFTNAMSVAILGAILKFIGSNWYVAGVFFGLSLGLLFLWGPRHMAANSAEPA